MLQYKIDTLRRRVEKLKSRKADETKFPERKLEFRGANLEVQTNKSKQLLLVGSAGTGKSTACLNKVYDLCMKYPDIRVLFIRKTRSSLQESLLVTWEQHILGYGHPMLNGATRQNRTSYVFPNNSRINIGGMDKADRVLSSDYDLIYICEAHELTEDDADALASRLRNGKLPYHQLLMDCNPQSKTHWLYQKYEKGKLKMLTSFHQDNPMLFDKDTKDWTELGKEYLKTLSDLAGVRYRRLFLGEWCSAEGAVFEFDRNLHTTNTLPRMQRYICGVDWGHSDPGAMVVVGQGVDNKLYVVEEILETGKTLDYWEGIAHRMVKQYGIERFMCDPSLQAHVQSFLAHGLPAARGMNKIQVGIDLIQQRLSRRELSIYNYSSKIADPVLREKRLPVNLIEELESCVWNESKDLPKSGNDHALDALRYAVVQFDRPRMEVTPSLSQSFGMYRPNRYQPRLVKGYRGSTNR